MYYTNKAYCWTYEGTKHAPFDVCCLIVILVNIDTNIRYQNKLTYMTINRV